MNYNSYIYQIYTKMNNNSTFYHHSITFNYIITQGQYICTTVRERIQLQIEYKVVI